MANIDRFAQAGIVDPKKVSDSDKALIEKLSESEVDALISAHSKLGTDAIKAMQAKGMTMF